MWQSVKILNFFNTLTLQHIFWKTKTFFKKLGYRFLVETTKIENASYPYKTAISESSVKTNRMVTTKWTYHEERSFASNYLFFWKFCFSLRTSYKELICCTNNPNIRICSFCKRSTFILWCFFPVSILNKDITEIKSKIKTTACNICTKKNKMINKEVLCKTCFSPIHRKCCKVIHMILEKINGDGNVWHA